MAPHESASSSPQTSIEEGGESSPDEGAEHASTPEGEAPPSEPPITLQDLLGLVFESIILQKPTYLGKIPK